MSSKASLPPVPLKITNLGAVETQMRAVIPAHTQGGTAVHGCVELLWGITTSPNKDQVPQTPGQAAAPSLSTQTLTAQLCSLQNFQISWFQEAEINKKVKSLEIPEEIGREVLPPFPFFSCSQPKHTAL